MNDISSPQANIPQSPRGVQFQEQTMPDAHMSIKKKAKWTVNAEPYYTFRRGITPHRILEALVHKHQNVQ
jgi:hypothetical protein